MPVASAVLGFPRMGRDRELKKITERYWGAKATQAELLSTAAQLRVQHWQLQKDAGVDVIPSNDFALYDQVLDHSLLFNAIPPRYQGLGLDAVDTAFAMGRGLQRPAKGDQPKIDVPSQEMVKWFDSNYHYLRPELSPSTDLKLAAEPKPLVQFQEAKAAGIATRPVLIGPVTFLWLSKAGKEAPAGFEPASLIEKLVPLYGELINKLTEAGATTIQIDEPALVMDLPASVSSSFASAYASLAKAAPKAKLIVSTYFGAVADVSILTSLPVAGVHVDLVRAPGQLEAVLAAVAASSNKDLILSLGIVDGRNIWKNRLQESIATVQRAVSALGGKQERVLVATSSSLLHCPHTVESEPVVGSAPGATLPAEVKDWFAFAKEKCAEVAIIAKAINQGAAAIQDQLNANSKSLAARSASKITTDSAVRERQAAVTPAMTERTSAFPAREALQADALKLPLFPTTTIGSFPQTKEIRVQRDKFAKGTLSAEEYEQFVKDEIKKVVVIQEELGLDVLVHGEPERNDMVQYFLERMDGCAFTAHGWVQSYGSRCVRPPILIGDVSRPRAMTVKEAVYAQSLTQRPMKGMLTGPITCLRWSFPRDDLSLQQQAQQLALAIRDEVKDLEAAGIRVIQIDEPALREGLPLRKQDQESYLTWAVAAFKLSTCTVADATQIHSHFCYSDFNEIFHALVALDADCITIESSKSDLKLLGALGGPNSTGYPNAIGPGVYDIHSPRVPSLEEIIERVTAMRKVLRPSQLWINPDCGLKTRGWEETKAALLNMVAAAKQARVDQAGK